jgi:hypothetical protein
VRTEPPPQPRRHPILAVVGGAFVCFVTLVLLVLFSPTDRRVSAVQFYAFLIAAVALPIVIGSWLLRVGWSAFSGWRLRNLLAVRRGEFWRRAATTTYAALRLTRPRLMTSPFRRLELALLIGGVEFVLAPKHLRWIGVLLGWTGYTLADPLISSRRPHWWINLLKSIAGCLILFLTAGIVTEVDDLGDASMVFILPLLIYPFTLGASAIIRLLWGLPEEE